MNLRGRVGGWRLGFLGLLGLCGVASGMQVKVTASRPAASEPVDLVGKLAAQVEGVSIAAGRAVQVPLPRFWPGGEHPEGIWILRVQYKDTSAEPVQVNVYSGEGGSYGWHYAGQIAGQADDQERAADIFVPGWMFGVRPQEGGQPQAAVSFRSPKAELAIERIQVLGIPADRQFAARQAWFAAKDKYRAVLAARSKEIPYEEKTPLQPVAPEHRRLGFVPFVRSYLQPVYPNTVPTQKERNTRLALAVTPAEAEPVLFGIRSLDEPLENLRVEVKMQSSEKTPFPASAVSLGVVEFAAIRWGSSSAVTTWQVRPDRIWPVERFPGNAYLQATAPGVFVLPARTTAAFWLTIRPGPDVNAGLYRGTVTVRAGQASQEFDLQVQVLPFRLARNDRWWIGMYISDQSSDREIADMASHGINATSQWPHGYRIVKRKDKPVVEFLGQDEYMRRLQAGGITGPHVWFQGNDANHKLDKMIAQAMGVEIYGPEYLKHYVDVVRQFHDHASKAGWNRLIWCPFDEPGKGGTAQEQWLIDAKAIREGLGKEVTLFAVMLNRGVERAKQFVPYPDIWSANGKIPEMVALAKEHKNELWSYGGASHRSDPADSRYSYGFNVWRSGVQGHYCWAYNWGGEGDPFVDLDDTHMDWFVSFRDADGGVITSPGWEGLREGTDDLRYLLTAMQLIESKQDHPRADWARAQLETVGQKVSGKEAAPDTTGIDVLGKEFVPSDDSAMTWARSKLIEIILALRE